MTEEEAKTKWCPMARALAESSVSAAVNRTFESGAEDPDCRCLASGCMAWRFDELPHLNLKGAPALEIHGYCGLAGRP